MARKKKLGQSTAKEDEEYEKEKKELSLFLIIAFDEHKEVDMRILDQGLQSLHGTLNIMDQNHYMMKLSWKLHKSSGVHTLKTDTEMVIHMLVEKKYPLMKKVLLQMLELKLESEDDNTMSLELIKFIKVKEVSIKPALMVKKVASFGFVGQHVNGLFSVNYVQFVSMKYMLWDYRKFLLDNPK
ncbi:hypothetical protein Tco_0898072 [Tanacetum coccineum]